MCSAEDSFQSLKTKLSLRNLEISSERMSTIIRIFKYLIRTQGSKFPRSDVELLSTFFDNKIRILDSRSSESILNVGLYFYDSDLMKVLATKVPFQTVQLGITQRFSCGSGIQDESISHLLRYIEGPKELILHGFRTAKEFFDYEKIQSVLEEKSEGKLMNVVISFDQGEWLDAWWSPFLALSESWCFSFTLEKDYYKMGIEFKPLSDSYDSSEERYFDDSVFEDQDKFVYEGEYINYFDTRHNHFGGRKKRKLVTEYAFA